MLRMDVYIGWDYKGTIMAAQSFVVTLRHNAIGETTITLPGGHDLQTFLMNRLSRAIIYYKDEPVMSGWVKTFQLSGYPKMLTVTVTDDKAVLWNMIGWPIPTAALTSQSSTHYTVTAVQETAIKQIIKANADERFPNLNVITTLGRGTSIKIKSRFAPISEFIPLIEPNGISAIQNGNQIDIDFYTPDTYPENVAERSGQLTVESYTVNRPRLTRAIVGDESQKTTRKFRQVIRSSDETFYGDVMETFLDARGTNVNGEMDDQANEALDEAAPNVGLSVKLAEVNDFAFGESGFKLGDYVPIELEDGTVVSEQIKEVVISHTPDAGLSVRPSIGEKTDDPTRSLVRIIKALSRKAKSLEREY